jgi:hypothetical protein
MNKTGTKPSVIVLSNKKEHTRRLRTLTLFVGIAASVTVWKKAMLFVSPEKY